MPNVIDSKGSVVREIVTPAAFEKDFGDKSHVIYRAIHREFSNPRAGTASTKKRDEVSGGGRKPWKQKGTGRARQGSIRSPQWRHGGVVFGPQPRKYIEDLNKKERRIAFIAALADRFKAGAVTVFDVSGFAIDKTGDFAKLLFGSSNNAKKGPTTLVIVGIDEKVGDQIERVSRNLGKVGVTNAGALDVKDVLRYNRLVFTVEAYEAITSKFAAEEESK